MFKRVLIANRGEVANRIISTCLDLGIETVAIYSEDDRSLHYLNRADYAYCIGKGPVSSSYKNMDAIIAAAKMANADCVHPGYGFLAEDATFAKLCEQNNLVFIGADKDLLTLLGNKLKVRAVAKKLGINIVPSCESAVSDVKTGIESAKKLGYPIIIKPVAGTHARGIRKVDNEAGFEKAFIATQIESTVVLNDNSLIIEKALSGAKHIEVPILRDKGGRILCLPELDGSVQRRYLKIMSETPAPGISDDVRKKLKDWSEKLVASLNFVGLASFEYLVKDGVVYFLEVNPRLTVEHSGTEMVTGLDLVKQQFLISAGEPLELHSKEIRCRGVAMQSRIYAEDPETFEPKIGTVNDVFIPTGPNVRHELIAHSGWKIPIHYDHMLAKMTVWGPDRSDVANKMTHLLKDCFYSGIITNIPLQRHIFSSKEVGDGSYNVDFMREVFVFNRQEPTESFKEAMKMATAIRVYKQEESKRGDVSFTSTPISSWTKEIGTGRL